MGGWVGGCFVVMWCVDRWVGGWRGSDIQKYLDHQKNVKEGGYVAVLSSTLASPDPTRDSMRFMLRSSMWSSRSSFDDSTACPAPQMTSKML